jgi:hypothetical protein
MPSSQAGISSRLQRPSSALWSMGIEISIEKSLSLQRQSRSERTNFPGTAAGIGCRVSLRGYRSSFLSVEYCSSLKSSVISPETKQTSKWLRSLAPRSRAPFAPGGRLDRDLKPALASCFASTSRLRTQSTRAQSFTIFTVPGQVLSSGIRVHKAS